MDQEELPTTNVSIRLLALRLPSLGQPLGGKMDTSMTTCSWEKAPMVKCVYRHPSTQAAMDVYVDDFEMVASLEDTPKLWKALEAHVDFKEPYKIWGEDSTTHLGCDYSVKHWMEGKHRLTSVKAFMKDYHLDFTKRFEEKWGVNLPEVDTPWLDDSARNDMLQNLKQRVSSVRMPQAH
jgi:hypothetical protein